MNSTQTAILDRHLTGACSTGPSCTCSTDMAAADTLDPADFHAIWADVRAAGLGSIRDLTDHEDRRMGFRTITTGIGGDAETLGAHLASRGLNVWQAIGYVVRIAL